MLSRKGTTMKKLIFAVVVLSLGYFTLVKADDKTYTISDTLNTVSLIPQKISNHISNEVDKTKEFQKASWAEVKFKWKGFKEKFLSN
jgi:hypothetical protein